MRTAKFFFKENTEQQLLIFSDIPEGRDSFLLLFEGF